VHTYSSGVIGFTFCSKRYYPINNFNKTEVLKLNDLKYYNKGIHTATFNLPALAQGYRD